MVEYADDPRSELERKAEQLKWVAALETVSYALLFLFWVVLDNLVGTKIMGFFHGWIFLAFAAMVVFIARPMRWSWTFVAVGSDSTLLAAALTAELASAQTGAQS